MSDLGNRIAELRHIKGWSQGQLALKIGKTRGLISYWEINKRTPNKDDLLKLATIFDVSTDYLLGNNIGDEDEINILSKITYMDRSVKVYGCIPAGIPIEAIENIIDEVEIPSFLSKKKDLFGLKIKGDSMNKIIGDGMIGVFQKTDTLENGEIGAILVNGYDATVKRFYKLTNSYVLEPQSYNPEYQPMIIQEDAEPVSVVGKLIWFCPPKDWDK